MHKSQLAGFIIDCQTDDLAAAAEFWTRALGLATRTTADPADNNYVVLDTQPDGLHIELQKVAHSPRVHLDIAADDVEAEVRRLETLGAKRIQQVRTWWIMEAPTGHRFCVIAPQQAGFETRANQWDD